jgi:hypothetical protein
MVTGISYYIFQFCGFQDYEKNNGDEWICWRWGSVRRTRACFAKCREVQSLDRLVAIVS